MNTIIICACACTSTLLRFFFYQDLRTAETYLWYICLCRLRTEQQSSQYCSMDCISLFVSIGILYNDSLEYNLSKYLKCIFCLRFSHFSLGVYGLTQFSDNLLIQFSSRWLSHGSCHFYEAPSIKLSTPDFKKNILRYFISISLD